ncbi:MAG: PAS domain-containing protein [Burkholderiaceae bacterium]
MNFIDSQFLLEAEERLDFQITSDIANAMDKIVWVTQPDGRVVYCNQHWFEYTGMTLTQAKRVGWLSAVHTNDMQQCVEQWTKALKAGKPNKSEFRLLRADGTYRWHLCFGMPVLNAHGKITRWFGICRDIEDYVHTQKTIRENYVKDKQKLMVNFVALADSNARLARENLKLKLAISKPMREQPNIGRAVERRSFRNRSSTWS